jgi:AraC-like DNA-binding protein
MDDILSNLRLDVLIAERSRLGPEWRNRAPQNDPFARLYYIVSGKGYISHSGGSYELEPGGLYMIPPNSGFSHRCPDRVEIHWAHFNASFFSAVWAGDILRMRCFLPNAADAAERMGGLVDAFKSPGPSASVKTGGFLLLLLSALIEDAPPGDIPLMRAAARLKPALDLMEKNPGGKISVPALAKAASMERAYFSVVFKRAFKISPAKLMLQKKIERARLMLLSGGEKTERIARELGFSDAFHFSKTFKKHTGVSPSEHRKKRGFPMP